MTGQEPERERARRRLLALPTAGLGNWPTPFHRLDRFGAALGVEVWIKRDDVQGVALAGNKIRKFNLVVGGALADGFDTLVTTGARQSNSARTGAAAAAATGIDCHLVLSGDPSHSESEHTPTANLLLDHLLDATVHHAGDASWHELNQLVDEIVAGLNAKGRKAFAAPVGCSSPLGALGFAQAFLELEAQMAAAEVVPSAIVHTTTSGGTHAGLLVGRAIARDERFRGVPIVGVDAGRLYGDVAAQYHELATAAADLLDVDLDIAVADLTLVHDQVGRAYGALTDPALEAIRLMARTEAVVVDPVYSAKGLAGLIALVRGDSRQGGVDVANGPVVFWHTGGYHALFDPRHGSPCVIDS